MIDKKDILKELTNQFPKSNHAVIELIFWDLIILGYIEVNKNFDIVKYEKPTIGKLNSLRESAERELDFLRRKKK